MVEMPNSDQGDGMLYGETENRELLADMLFGKTGPRKYLGDYLEAQLHDIIMGSENYRKYLTDKGKIDENSGDLEKIKTLTELLFETKLQGGKDATHIWEGYAGLNLRDGTTQEYGQ